MKSFLEERQRIQGQKFKEQEEAEKNPKETKPKMKTEKDHELSLLVDSVSFDFFIIFFALTINTKKLKQ